MNPNDIIVATNHHRRMPCFMDTMQRLWNAGFRHIWVQETGNGSWGWYDGPSEWMQKSENISYDMGMMRFKNFIHPGIKVKAIFFIDCDCFISDTEELFRFISDFEIGGYSYSCHHISKESYSPSYVYNGCIAPVTDQRFIPDNGEFGFHPEPHWENTYALITKDMWDKLGPDDVLNTRLWFKTMHRLGGKFGVREAEYRFQYTHFGKSWFHFGNLMSFLYAVEQFNPSKFSIESDVAMSRLGFLAWQERIYGRSAYPEHVMTKLHKILDSDGRAVRAEEAWNKLSSGTCMENWKRC